MREGRSKGRPFLLRTEKCADSGGWRALAFAMRSIVLPLLLLGLSACASRPIESYPWVVQRDYPCRMVVVGLFQTDRSCADARVTVRATDGSEIPATHYVEVRFYHDGGAIIRQGRGPEFTATILRRHIRDAWIYRWTATVREDRAGPILYQTPAPQPFEPDEPIVIWVDPVR